MQRIYFDKQIFSHLFKGEKPLYKSLLEAIFTTKERFLFCYSQAHLSDLQNDKTPIKYQELDFMETIVDRNALLFDNKRKCAFCYDEAPRTVFDSQKSEEFSFDSIFDLLDKNDLTEDQKKQLENAQKLFTRPIDFGLPVIDLADSTLPEAMKQSFPFFNGPMSIMDAYKGMLSYYETMTTDRQN